MANTYHKFAPNVFLAKCAERHDKGATILVTTKYGKENECIIWNLIAAKDGFYYYSFTRADGFNSQERAKNRAKKFSKWAHSAEKISEREYKKADLSEDATGIVFGQPILVGHHSEKKHRAALERADNAMRRSIDWCKKAEAHEDKSTYWESRANDIDMSMPESLEYFEYKLEEARMKHEGLKDGSIPRDHSFSLTYAKKEVNDIEKKFDLAKRLWA